MREKNEEKTSQPDPQQHNILRPAKYKTRINRDGEEIGYTIVSVGSEMLLAGC